MFDVTFLARERLIDRARHELPTIGLIAAFAALAALPQTMPAAYVVPLGETAGRNGANQGAVQIKALTFGVVLAVKHAGDVSGAKASTKLHELRQLVQATLTGWRPVAGADEYVEFVGGQLLAAEDSAVIWRDDFAVRRLAFAPPQET